MLEWMILTCLETQERTVGSVSNGCACREKHVDIFTWNPKHNCKHSTARSCKTAVKHANTMTLSNISTPAAFYMKCQKNDSPQVLHLIHIDWSSYESVFVHSQPLKKNTIPDKKKVSYFFSFKWDSHSSPEQQFVERRRKKDILREQFEVTWYNITIDL